MNYVLSFSWMRLGFMTAPNGKVPVKVIARTFASGKTEKFVYQCLAELELPSDKVSKNVSYRKYYAATKNNQ